MSTTPDYLTSPKGTIQFLALNRKVGKDMKPNSVQGYAVRLKFDGSTKEGAEWKKTISAINPNLIGTKHVDNKNEFTVRAFSQFLPEVLDNNLNTVEELPNFYSESTGTATMAVLPYMGNEMGGSINWVGLVIHEIDVGEAPSTEGNREAIVAKLREHLKNAG